MVVKKSRMLKKKKTAKTKVATSRGQKKLSRKKPVKKIQKKQINKKKPKSKLTTGIKKNKKTSTPKTKKIKKTNRATTSRKSIKPMTISTKPKKINTTKKTIAQMAPDVTAGNHAFIFAQTNHNHNNHADAETSTVNPPKKNSRKDFFSEDPTQIYLHEIGYKSLLTPKEELKIARLVQQGDSQARKKMIESNLRLVVKVARHYVNRGLPFLDLIEEGNLGLMTAVEKFDPRRGFRFSTYAVWWIRQTIERAIMNQSRTVRLPIHVIKELNVYLRAAKTLTQKLDHAPSPEEIAEMIDKPVEDIRQILDLMPDVTSIDTPLSEDSQKTLVDILPDEANIDPAAFIEGADLQVHLDEWLSNLDERHREVVIRRFGLHGHEKGTLEEVGEAVGLTRERVRQIQLDALRQLRRMLEQSGFEGEL